MQVEFSLLAAAQVPVQGSPHGLGELAVHLRGRAHEERGCPSPPAPLAASSQFLQHRDVRAFPPPPDPVGFNTQDIVQIKMSWGHNRFF